MIADTIVQKPVFSTFNSALAQTGVDGCCYRKWTGGRDVAPQLINSIGIKEIGFFGRNSIQFHGEDCYAAYAVADSTDKFRFSDLPPLPAVCPAGISIPGKCETRFPALFFCIDRSFRQSGSRKTCPVPAGCNVFIFQAGAHNQTDPVRKIASESIVPVRIIFNRAYSHGVHSYRCVPFRATVHHIIGIPEMAISCQ